jgi:hypothetical protein
MEYNCPALNFSDKNVKHLIDYAVQLKDSIESANLLETDVMLYCEEMDKFNAIVIFLRKIYSVEDFVLRHHRLL